jgi:hypothetical protein
MFTTVILSDEKCRSCRYTPVPYARGKTRGTVLAPRAGMRVFSNVTPGGLTTYKWVLPLFFLLLLLLLPSVSPAQAPSYNVSISGVLTADDAGSYRGTLGVTLLVPDAGFRMDAGFPDTGLDSGTRDSGLTVDSGLVVDSGLKDSGFVDSGSSGNGSIDSGFADATFTVDSGLTDSGFAADAGGPPSNLQAFETAQLRPLRFRHQSQLTIRRFPYQDSLFELPLQYQSLSRLRFTQ